MPQASPPKAAGESETGRSRRRAGCLSASDPPRRCVPRRIRKI